MLGMLLSHRNCQTMPHTALACGRQFHTCGRFPTASARVFWSTLVSDPASGRRPCASL